MLCEAGNASGKMTLYVNRVGFDPRINRAYGLCKGSADLIGWRHSDGKFLALEVKHEDTKLEPHQEHWLAYVNQFGGIARVVRRIPEVLEVVQR